MDRRSRSKVSAYEHNGKIKKIADTTEHRTERDVTTVSFEPVTL